MIDTPGRDRDWTAIAEGVHQSLRPELDEFGIEALWAASNRALRYPPNWATTNDEFKAILRELEHTTQGDH